MWNSSGRVHVNDQYINYIKTEMMEDERYLMANIICRTSTLKCDDYNLKKMILSIRACDLCDSFGKEDITYLVLQCEV